MYIGSDQGASLISLGANNASSEPVEVVRLSAVMSTNTDNAEKGYLQICTANGAGIVERARLTETGDFGIGEDAPESKLHLRDLTANSAVQIGFENDARKWFWGVNGGIAGDPICLYDATASATRLVVNDTGNISYLTDGVVTSYGVDSEVTLTHVHNTGLSLVGNLQVSTGFGCNSKTPQTAYASGGALAAYAAGTNGLNSGANMSALHAMVVAIRAALVANGIMS